jgi:hypothetical protein
MADRLARFKSALEFATGLAVLLAAIGYMSLRAFLNPYGQKIETAQRRQRSNIFGLGPVLHNKLAADA